jgi:hypothetical protein
LKATGTEPLALLLDYLNLDASLQSLNISITLSDVISFSKACRQVGPQRHAWSRGAVNSLRTALSQLLLHPIHIILQLHLQVREPSGGGVNLGIQLGLRLGIPRSEHIQFLFQPDPPSLIFRDAFVSGCQYRSPAILPLLLQMLALEIIHYLG